MMDRTLTPSRTRVYNDCPRKHHYMYVRGWRPKRTPGAMSFGWLFHVGLEAWWESLAAGEPWDGLSRANAAIEEKADDSIERATAQIVMKEYDARYRDDHERYEVLQVEMKATVPLLHPTTMQPAPGWEMSGKLDAVVRDLAEDRVLLVEHKTTGSKVDDPAGPYWERLALDHQLTHYVVIAHGKRIAIDGCLYDVIRRPMLRQGKAETENGFLVRVAQHVEQDPDGYFVRRPVYRTAEDVRDYLADAWQTAERMEEDVLGGRRPRNPEACFRFGKCGFWDVCAYGLDPEDHPERYDLLDVAHPELELTGDDI